MGHSPFAGLHQVVHSVFKCTVFREASSFANPEAAGIKLGDLVDSEKLPGMVVTAIVVLSNFIKEF